MGLFVRQKLQVQVLVFLFLDDQELILALHLAQMRGDALMACASGRKGE